MEKILVAMSGGVDSSVAAELLLREGYDVSGAIMKLYGNEDIGSRSRTCCSLSDVEDARSAAYRLGIDFFVFNFEDRFREAVMQKFCDCYLRCETPNPCIDCNNALKFGAFLSRAELLGYDKIATGHYARIRYDEESGRYLLLRGINREKDQSYVLYAMTQHVLSKTLLPIGEAESKDEVRRLAEAGGLLNAGKPDSQDICFVPDGDYAAFIERFSGVTMPKGNFVSPEGEVLGEHSGLFRYTVGQRRGLGISADRRLFVLGKSADNNTVTVGDESLLYKDTLLCRDANFIPFDTLSGPLRVTAKTRYRQKDEPAVIEPCEDGMIRCTFDSPQRAVTPGQSAVFYNGEIVVGGGIIV